ncbi:hypothetical protein AGOR_G00227930 [Albula goreensis]|uniref:Fibronectin type-III domain-containing protein n=1 Tax=Albula goreensis TaxID=1534307 RepID=A0A8T3CPY0_9TELE|nr:hypothetical protein AGOR_G00227930 [Albula goreensis]
MDVAVAEEPQKKIFRARKTMKISDRQQLESLHNTLTSNPQSSSSSTSSSSPPPPLVNGKHPDEGQMETEKDKDKTENVADNSPKEADTASPISRSPTPLALALSLSPSPPAKTPEEVTSSSPPPSPSHSGDPNSEETEEGQGDEDKLLTGPTTERGKKKDGEKEEKEEEEEEEKEKGKSKCVTSEEEKKEDLLNPQESAKELSAASPLPSANSKGKEEDKEKASEANVATDPEGAAMDTSPSDSAPEDGPPTLGKSAADSSLVQSPTPPANTSPSPSLSPSHAPESDQEVKEGFLVLSEEEESQGEKDDEKDKDEVKDEQEEEKMEVDAEKEGEKEEVANGGTARPASPPSASPAPSPGEEAGEQDGAGMPSARKRAMSGESEADGKAESREEGKAEEAESQSKRPRVEREELEAHLELKISGNPDTRQKLEKVVQQLVAEQLRVLQLSVFDRSLQELRERVDKIDCATKHQQTLNTLQAKIARLTKKFGAANQAKENARKPQEMLSSSSGAAATPTASTNGTPAPRTVRALLDSKRGDHSGQNASSTGPAVQPKVLSGPAPSSSGPVLSLGSAVPTSAVTSVTPSQNQPLTLKTNTPNSPVTSAATATAPKPVSLQPLLIQLPLSVANTQGGALMANHNSGMELVPVTSLAAVSPLNKAKTTNATTTFIIQKTVPPSSSASTSSPSAAQTLPSSPSLPQITLARAACISAVGATSSSSLPTSSTPAATGGQSSGAAASAPLSGAAMASKTDNQATNRTPDSTTAKSSVPTPRTSRAGAVIDLTEDDDDVLVTGVKKAPVQSSSSVAASPSSSSPSLGGPQRPPAGPPPLTSHTSLHTQPNAQTPQNVLQRCQAVAPSRAPPTTSRVLPSSSSSSSSLSAPPLHSSGTGAVGSVRGLVGVTAAVGSNRQGSPQATAATVRSSPQSSQHLNGPQLTVHHRPLQDLSSKNLPPGSTSSGPASSASHLSLSLPHCPRRRPRPRLPPEAAHTSPPQQPQLKLARVQSQNGIVLSWCVEETDRTCAAVDSYHLYAYHQDHSGPVGSPASQWKKIGEVKALPLPMACTLTQFVSGSKYYFAVRARDVYGRFGPFCEPQCTDVITPSTTSN